MTLNQVQCLQCYAEFKSDHMRNYCEATHTCALRGTTHVSEATCVIANALHANA